MRVLNVGNRVVNTYLYPTENGCVLIDTGYAHSYLKFKRNLLKMGLKVVDIRYVFLTHAHDDHAGFLNALLTEVPTIEVVASHRAVPTLLKGQNPFQGGCSSRRAFAFCLLLKALGKGDHRFPPLKKAHLSRVQCVTDESREILGNLLKGKIIDTPGHTADSISLLRDDGVCFCGDAAMNGFPSHHKLSIWIEDKAAYQTSWKTLTALAPKRLYPSHGKPFAPEALVRNKRFIERIGCYPIKNKNN